MAPIAAKFFNLAVLRRDVRNEVDGLLEGIIGYFSAAKSGWGFDCGSEGLGLCFQDLVRVLVVNRFGGERKFSEGLKVFVPGASDGIREGIVSGVGYLGGVVMCEVLLLRLCLKVEVGVSQSKLEEELVACALQYHCFSMCTLLMSFSRCYWSQFSSQLFTGKIRTRTNSTVSLISDGAINFLTCYVDTSSNRTESFHIVIDHWTNWNGYLLLKIKVRKSLIVSSKIYAKAIICKSRMEFGPLVTTSDIWNLNGNRFSYANGEERIKQKADDDLKTVDFIEGMTLGAFGLVKLTGSDNTEKHKEGRNFEVNEQCKFPKCHVNHSLMRENFSLMEMRLAWILGVLHIMLYLTELYN